MTPRPPDNSAPATRPLALYVRAICNHPSARAIESRTTQTRVWQEVGFEVVQETATYRFLDGTVVRRTIEQDSMPAGASVCPECWITYEVVAQGSSADFVTPARMTFNSACRESFWLAHHLAGDGAGTLCAAATIPEDAP